MYQKRIQFLNDVCDVSKGEFVLYWMSHSQRVHYNHALGYAIERSKEFYKPLLVLFVVDDKFPNANSRHFYFMLEGLKEVEIELSRMGVKFIILRGNPIERVNEVANRAVMVITDKGYTRIEALWRSRLGEMIDKPLVQVETDVLIPVEELSKKEEYSAATIRRKIKTLLEDYLREMNFARYDIRGDLDFESELSLENIDLAIKQLDIDKSVCKSKYYKGGYSKAKENLKLFIENKMQFYNQLKNDPSKDVLSNLSPYLHFGQISSLEIVLELRGVAEDLKSGFLEELITRRELSYNFTTYNENYDTFECLPKWAIDTLEAHMDDDREYTYSLSDLENYMTHDRYWNAAQKELVITGKMNGYMRMYWGKKVIQWSDDYKKAYEYLIYLNDKYSLDGRDPNGYAGIAWVFGKHDRPWVEREIFGKVRYMNDKGLERKFYMEDYLKKIDQLKMR